MVCLLIDWLYSVFHEVNWKIRPDQSQVEFLYKAINVTEIIGLCSIQLSTGSTQEDRNSP